MLRSPCCGLSGGCHIRDGHGGDGGGMRIGGGSHGCGARARAHAHAHGDRDGVDDRHCCVASVNAVEIHPGVDLGLGPAPDDHDLARTRTARPQQLASKADRPYFPLLPRVPGLSLRRLLARELPVQAYV